MTLRELQQQADAEWMSYGPPEEGGAEIAATFGHYPAEYAAIRQRVGIAHLPQRGLVRLTGADAADFLHRLVSQDINGLQPGRTRRALQLTAKGRIVADLLVHRREDALLVETDRIDVPQLTEVLSSRLFAEDVIMEEISGSRTALSLHGPAALALLRASSEAADELANGLEPGENRELSLLGRTVLVHRRDVCGVMGLHLWAEAESAAELWQALLEKAGFDAEAEREADEQYAQRRRQTLRGRPVGWMAINTCRIEAGTPMFHIDFGPDSLPGEVVPVQEEAVSFSKGCYLGQEIVARMQSLGHPARVLVALELGTDKLPVAGTQVLDPQDPTEVIGGITSSALSPVQGNVAIALAMMKWDRHEPGSKVAVIAEQTAIEGEVRPIGAASEEPE
ncbi:MAG: YgfZ/GcvT domain-containing protein [Phycisphaeraceae bacterium]